MESCAHCNLSLGTQEAGVKVFGKKVHTRCENAYIADLRGKARAPRGQLLHFSVADKEPEGFGDGGL